VSTLNAYALTTAGNVVKYESLYNRWTTIPGQGIDIAASENDRVYIISTTRTAWNGSSIMKLDKKTNRFVAHSVQIRNPMKITLDFRGEPWIVNTYGEIYSWTG
jgi:hypothetical protein